MTVELLDNPPLAAVLPVAPDVADVEAEGVGALARTWEQSRGGGEKVKGREEEVDSVKDRKREEEGEWAIMGRRERKKRGEGRE